MCTCTRVKMHVYASIHDIKRRSLVGCLIVIGHFSQKSPIVSGSFAKSKSHFWWIHSCMCMHPYMCWLIHSCMCMHETTHSCAHTEWRRPLGCLIFIGHVPQKSPILSGSFAKRDLQLKASYGSLPTCIMYWCIHTCITARPYESCKIFKGRPRRNAFSKLVRRQYKSFPPDRFCQVEMKKPTKLSNKSSNAWSCAQDQILENKNLRNMILNICTER